MIAKSKVNKMAPTPGNTNPMAMIDAAQALLALQNFQASHYVVQYDQNKKATEMEDAALVLSGLIRTTDKSPPKFFSQRPLKKRKLLTTEPPELTHEDIETLKTNGPLAFSSPISKENNLKPVKITFDVGTQTDPEPLENKIFSLKHIEAMEETIEKLSERIRNLQAQLGKYTRSDLAESETENDSNKTKIFGYIRRRTGSSSHQNSSIRQRNTNSSSTLRSSNETSDFTNMDMSDMDITDGASDEESDIQDEKPKTNVKDMVPIGDGNTMVPSRILKQMNWTSYTVATRKLLTAVFSRRTLATHSLTGKPSPAFPNKPAKKKLNSSMVNDIVHIVVEKCGVPENVVRTSITTKCADESKMLRTREENKKSKSKFKKNNENLSPSSDESN